MTTHATIHHGDHVPDPQARKDLFWQGEFIPFGKSFWSKDHLVVADHLIAFAFHESKTIVEATKEASAMEMLVTLLYLD